MEQHPIPQSKTVQFDLSRSKVYRLSGPVLVHYWRAHWTPAMVLGGEERKNACMEILSLGGSRIYERTSKTKK